MTTVNDREVKKHCKHSYRSAFGKSTVKIDCPFCGDTVTAYIWSLAGGGKKCTCGALHGSFGNTLAPLPKKTKL